MQAQQLVSQSSYLSANDPRLHFGLGDEKKVDLAIYWPNGLEEHVHNVAANQPITIQEGSGVVNQVDFGSANPPPGK